MWGSWFTITLGITVGAVLGIVALAFGGWAVLIALGIFAVVGMILLAGAAWRRSGEYVEHGDEAEAPQASQGPREAPPGPTRSGGAPVSGEGS